MKKLTRQSVYRNAAWLMILTERRFILLNLWTVCQMELSKLSIHSSIHQERSNQNWESTSSIISCGTPSEPWWLKWTRRLTYSAIRWVMATFTWRSGTTSRFPRVEWTFWNKTWIICDEKARRRINRLRVLRTSTGLYPDTLWIHRQRFAARGWRLCDQTPESNQRTAAVWYKRQCHTFGRK